MSTALVSNHPVKARTQKGRMDKLEAVKGKVELWLKAQPPQVEVALVTLGGAVQGGFLGAVMSSFSSLEPPGATGAAPKVQCKACFHGGSANPSVFSHQASLAAPSCWDATSR